MTPRVANGNSTERWIFRNVTMENAVLTSMKPSAISSQGMDAFLDDVAEAAQIAHEFCRENNLTLLIDEEK